MDVVSENFMERTEKDWLDWLMAETPELIHQPIRLKKQYPEEYQRILQVVGNWMTVESKLERYQAEEYRPAETLSEELKALECDVLLGQVEPERDEVLQPKKPKNPERAPRMRLLSVRKIDKDFKMPEPNPRYAKTKYSEIYRAKPYSSVMQPPKPGVQPKHTMQNVEEDERMKELTNVEETPKKQRKERIVMSDEQMREFVLEAMKALGEKPSKLMYDAYAKEHGGVTATSLAHHGLGISQWPRIAAEERAKLPADETPNVPEEPEQLSDAKSLEGSEQKEPDGAMLPPEPEQQHGAVDVLQMIVHGIDATVMIGGLEVQVRLDFGPKK